MLDNVILGKVALAVVAVAGMALCTLGIGKVAAAGAWLDAWSVVAYVIGAAVLALVVAVLLGARIPLVGTPWAATLVVVGLIAVKAAISRLHAL